MLSNRFSSYLPIAACALLLGLGGCAAAPLAQMAVSQRARPDPSCSGCSTGGANSFGNLPKGVVDSLRKLATATSDRQTAAEDAPTK
jgi:hypothetical protein